MALDTNEQFFDDPRFTDAASTIIQTVRTGVDDGTDFAAGAVVQVIDGVLELSNDRVAVSHLRRVAAVVASVAVAATATAVDTGAPTPVGILAYLKAKFPEDFS